MILYSPAILAGLYAVRPPFPPSPGLLELARFARGVWATKCIVLPPLSESVMAKPGRKVKKANHGKRPACSRPRKNRRQQVKT